MRTSRKTDFRQKNETSAGLKITFVGLTYPGHRPELPSLSHHFLLIVPSRALSEAPSLRKDVKSSAKTSNYLQRFPEFLCYGVY